MEDYDKIKKTLAIAFMNDLDANRPEGKMCLSNGECADIEKAFNEQDWPKLAKYLDKYTESEDERIRKWIIDDIKRRSIGWTHSEFTGEQILAWLEKQKEENHDGKKWIYEDDYHKDMERCFNDGKDEVLENPEKYGLQKEQKSAWSEEDKVMLNMIEYRLKDWDNIKAQQGYQDDYTLPSPIKWLKSLRPSWKPSEEQMVEGKIGFLPNGNTCINVGGVDEYKLGEKVRVIILPKEDKK